MTVALKSYYKYDVYVFNNGVDSMKNSLWVGGVFDSDGGRPSNMFAKLAAASHAATVINGGTLDAIRDVDVTAYDVVVWAPDVPNDEPKLVNDIKAKNPSCMLVITKNNRGGKYSHLMLVARALKAKANLLLEFTEVGSVIATTIIDPLGNVFCKAETDIDVVARTLVERLEELAAFTRIPSKCVGDANPYVQDQAFFELVRDYAEKFHTLIHAANQDRLLGNMSFRCENGFPSSRDGDLIYVSRRNIDKRDITPAGVVAVRLDNEDVVEFYGPHKPSVDTPIQVRLYNYYPNVSYMLHAHVYIEGAPFTDSIVPCGAVEEFDEIVHIQPDRSASNFCINLKGHGSLVLASSIDYVRNIPYISRLGD